MSDDVPPIKRLHSWVSLVSDKLKRIGPLTLSFIIALGSILAYFLFIGHPIWGTNDDVGMSMIAAGIVGSSQPTAELMFIHHYFGWLISRLCVWQPDVPWYGISFIGITTLSLVILNYSILRLRKQRPFSLLVLCGTIATVLPSLWHLQFTMVAALATLAGGMLLLSVLTYKPATRRSFIVAVLVSLGMLSIGSMIRFESALMTFALLAPCAMIMLCRTVGTMKSGESRRQYVATILLLGSFAGGSIIGLQALDRSHYMTSPGWEKWHSLNSAKSEFIDLKRVQHSWYTRDIFESVGWTRNDYDMIRSWQYVDPIRYSPEKFNTVINAIKARRLANPIYKSASSLRWLRGIPNFREIKSGISFLLTYVGGVLFGILIAGSAVNRWTRWNVLYLGSIVFTGSAIYCYLHFGLGRAPLRVMLPLLFSVLWAIMFVAASSNNCPTNQAARRNHWQTVTWGCLFLMFLGAMCYDYKNTVVRVTDRMADQKKLEQTIDTWSTTLPPESIIYSIGGALPVQNHLPLKSLAYFRSLDRFVGTGWKNQSPHQRQLITKLGLGDDFYASLAQKKYVYMVKRSGTGKMYLPILRDHYKEVHGLELSFIDEPNLPKLYRMVFKRIDQPIQN